MAGPQFQRYGGATPCVSVQAGERRIIFDAGSGIVALGQQLINQYSKQKRPLDAHIFITHLHHDHLMGLPFFGPIYMPQATLRVWGPRMGPYESFASAVSVLIDTPFFPVPLHEMQSDKQFHDISEAHGIYYVRGQREPIQLLRHHPDARRPDPDEVDLEIQILRGYNHPKCGVLIYKVIYQGKSVVFATDTEGYIHGDQRLITFAKDADVLIHDAMYTSDRYVSMPSPTQGYGHSTVESAARVAERANVKRLFLFHHDPISTDEDLDAVGVLGKTFFADSEVAYDGLTVEI